MRAVLIDCMAVLQAWEEYVADMNYIPAANPSGGRSDALFWRSLMAYHTLPR
jgi:hypothetical protein